MIRILLFEFVFGSQGLLIDFFHVVFIEDNGSGRLLFTMHTTLDNRLCYDKPPGRQFDPTRADDPDLNPSNDRPKFLSRTRMFGLNDPSYYRVRVLEYPKPDGKVLCIIYYCEYFLYWCFIFVKKYLLL